MNCGGFKEFYQLCAKNIFKNRFGGQTIVDIWSFAYVCGPCWARRWDIFNFKGYCVQSPFPKKNDLKAKKFSQNIARI